MAYKATEKLIDGAVWKEFNGAKLLIARSGNNEWLAAQAKLEKPHRKAIAKGNLGPKVKRRINIEAIAIGLLLDWREVEDAEGSPIPYTVEMGVTQMMRDPELLEFVIETSLELDNYRIADEEEVKNESSPPSDG